MPKRWMDYIRGFVVYNQWEKDERRNFYTPTAEPAAELI